MATPLSHEHLSRRERQIMDIIYQRSKASAAEVMGDLPDPPSYSAVRAMLRILEEKGHLKHKQERTKYVYLPTRPRDSAARSAMRRLLDTFFEGSTSKAVAALLQVKDSEMSKDELDHLSQLIDSAKTEGR